MSLFSSKHALWISWLEVGICTEDMGLAFVFINLNVWMIMQCIVLRIEYLLQLSNNQFPIFLFLMIFLDFFWFFKTIFFFCSRVSSPGSPNRGGDLLTQVGMAPREINWRNNPYVGCLPWASYPLLPKLSLTVLFVLESDHVFLPTNFDPILGPPLELDSFLFLPFSAASDRSFFLWILSNLLWFIWCVSCTQSWSPLSSAPDVEAASFVASFL